VVTLTVVIVLVTGDRKWSDFGAIRDFLESQQATLVVHGGATGADELASLAAQALGIECRVHEADWKRFGRKAGPIRNKDMFNIEQPHIVGAFHDRLPESRGTLDMVKYAKSKKTANIFHIAHETPVEEGSDPLDTALVVKMIFDKEPKQRSLFDV
jgi:hypothetical protein